MLKLISPDQLKNWSRCKRKYYYQTILKLNWPSDQRNFKLGQDVHKLMDYLSSDLDCTLLQPAATPDVRRCWEALTTHAIANLPIVASEWAFTVPMGEAWLVGRIDRIARDGDQILIIDWKTGTATPKNPEADWQTRVYSYAVTECYAELGLQPVSPEQLRFVYVEVKPQTGQIREVTVPYSREKHEATRALLEETVVAMANETEFVLPNTCPDRYCGYRSICGIDQVASSGN